MTIGRYCPNWEAPELKTHLKCLYRVIAEETPAYKGKPICVNPNRNNFRCCKEDEYSIKISTDIYQELPVGGIPGENMGAPIPPIQRVTEASVSLMAEIDSLSNSLADGHRAIGNFNEATRRWQEQYTGDPPGTNRNWRRPDREYRHEIQGTWNINSADEQFNPPEDLESLNPKECTKFEANERGNCKNLQWCFRVFGIELQCQQTRKEVIPKPLKEHRRLEVD